MSTPEAYTLPVTVPALVVGLLRRRRDPQASSWTAYGPGLAATLVPSLLAAWGDPGWMRPLLLGAAALVVTLLGARRRLQAPLLLGGAVLAAVAVHELAPYVVQVAVRSRAGCRRPGGPAAAGGGGDVRAAAARRPPTAGRDRPTALVDLGETPEARRR